MDFSRLQDANQRQGLRDALDHYQSRVGVHHAGQLAETPSDPVVQTRFCPLQIEEDAAGLLLTINHPLRPWPAVLNLILVLGAAITAILLAQATAGAAVAALVTALLSAAVGWQANQQRGRDTVSRLRLHPDRLQLQRPGRRTHGIRSNELQAITRPAPATLRLERVNGQTESIVFLQANDEVVEALRELLEAWRRPALPLSAAEQRAQAQLDALRTPDR